MRILKVAVHSFLKKEVNTMEKMSWTQPEVKELDVKETAQGTEFKKVPDGQYTDPAGNNWWSFS